MYSDAALSWATCSLSSLFLAVSCSTIDSYSLATSSCSFRSAICTGATHDTEMRTAEEFTEKRGGRRTDLFGLRVDLGLERLELVGELLGVARVLLGGSLDLVGARLLRGRQVAQLDQRLRQLGVLLGQLAGVTFAALHNQPRGPDQHGGTCKGHNERLTAAAPAPVAAPPPPPVRRACSSSCCVDASSSCACFSSACKSSRWPSARLLSSVITSSRPSCFVRSSCSEELKRAKVGR